MLLKCCTQYGSKFGKLSSGHGTGKGEFSFQCQRRTVPKYVQTYHPMALISHASKVMLTSCITSWQINEETMETVREFNFGGSTITADGDCSHEIKKTLAPWKKSYDQPRQHIKKQRHYFANKGPSSQSYGFSGSHV